MFQELSSDFGITPARFPYKGDGKNALESPSLFTGEGFGVGVDNLPGNYFPGCGMGGTIFLASSSANTVSM